MLRHDDIGRSARFRRREVLAGVTSSVLFAGFTETAQPDDHPAISNEKGAAVDSRPLMTVRIKAGSSTTQHLNAVPHGIRTIVPVTGGDFEGPRLRGRILPGGGDWLLLR